MFPANKKKMKGIFKNRKAISYDITYMWNLKYDTVLASAAHILKLEQYRED